MDTVTLLTVKKAILKVIEELEKNRQYFNDLDTPIGDSDHGDSICSTFSLVKKAVDEFDMTSGDIGALLACIGKSIILSGGAAMGPLYGTAFMDAGKITAGKNEINYEEFVALWSAFVDGIKRRGNVKPGEKTMYDTIFPAVEKLKQEAANGASIKQAIPAVIKAAEDGMNSTKDMLSTRGRSSRLGERSIGHIDPGSASMFCLISNFFTVVGEEL